MLLGEELDARVADLQLQPLFRLERVAAPSE